MTKQKLFAESRCLIAGCLPLALVVATLLFPQRALAEPIDNPFGLPEPHDLERHGSIVLHGGGHGLSDQFRAQFVELAGGRDAKIVLIPSDEVVQQDETEAEYEQRLSRLGNYGRWAALQAQGRIASFAFLYRRRDRWTSSSSPQTASLDRTCPTLARTTTA